MEDSHRDHGAAAVETHPTQRCDQSPPVDRTSGEHGSEGPDRGANPAAALPRGPGDQEGTRRPGPDLENDCPDR